MSNGRLRRSAILRPCMDAPQHSTH